MGLFLRGLGQTRGISVEAASSVSASKPPSSRLSSIKGAEQAAWAAQHGAPAPGGGHEAGQAIAGSISKGFWERKQEAFNAIPVVPKLLGFAGASYF